MATPDYVPDIDMFKMFHREYMSVSDENINNALIMNIVNSLLMYSYEYRDDFYETVYESYAKDFKIVNQCIECIEQVLTNLHILYCSEDSQESHYDSEYIEEKLYAGPQLQYLSCVVEENPLAFKRVDRLLRSKWWPDFVRSHNMFNEEDDLEFPDIKKMNFVYDLLLYGHPRGFDEAIKKHGEFALEMAHKIGKEDLIKYIKDIISART